MSELERLRDNVKNNVTMDDVCDRLGIHLGPSRKIRSIYRDEKTPSLHVYKSDYFDYATGQGGDVIRFVMDHQHWDFKKAVRWLARASSNDMIRTRKPSKVEEQEVDLTPFWHTIDSTVDPLDVMTRTEWPAYAAQKWGLTIGELIDYGSAFHRPTPYSEVELWTPHWHGGKVRGVKVRNMDGGKRSVTGSKYTYGLYKPTLEPRDGHDEVLFIVEGESDAWVLQSYLDSGPRRGGVVWGLPSGASLWRDSWRKDVQPFVQVFVITDSDQAGNEARERIVGSLTTKGLEDMPKVWNLWAPVDGRVAESIMAKIPVSAWDMTDES